MIGINYKDILKGGLKDPEFRLEWEKSEPEYQAGYALIKSRIEKKISQRRLAKLAKTTQAVVSRIERMSVSPTLALLQRLAMAMGKRLEIKFV